MADSENEKEKFVMDSETGEENWVAYWREKANWECIQQEVDIRAKTLALSDKPIAVTEMEGIMLYKNLCKLAPPDIDSLERNIYWIYAPVVLRLLEQACWVCLGIFEFIASAEPTRHWVYFVSENKFSVNHLRSYFSLFAIKDYFDLFKNDIILSHPLYEKMSNIIIKMRNEKKHWVNLDKGFPFIINLNKNVEAPGDWIDIERWAPYGLVFNLGDVWEKIIGNSAKDRIQQIEKLEKALPPFKDVEEKELVNFISHDTISLKEIYESYINACNLFEFSGESSFKSLYEIKKSRLKYLLEILEKINNCKETTNVKKRQILLESHTLLKLLLENENDLARKLLNYLILMADVSSDVMVTGDQYDYKKSNASAILTVPAWLPYGKMGKTAALIACFENYEEGEDKKKRDFWNVDIFRIVSAFRLGSINFALEKAKQTAHEAYLEMEVNKERTVAHLLKSLHAKLVTLMKSKYTDEKEAAIKVSKFLSLYFSMRQFYSFEMPKEFYYVNFIDFLESLIIHTNAIHNPTMGQCEYINEVFNKIDEYATAFNKNEEDITSGDFDKFLYGPELKEKILKSWDCPKILLENKEEISIEINLSKKKENFYPLLSNFTELLLNALKNEKEFTCMYLNVSVKDEFQYLILSPNNISKEINQNQNFILNFMSIDEFLKEEIKRQNKSVDESLEEETNKKNSKRAFGLKGIEFYFAKFSCHFKVYKIYKNADDKDGKFFSLFEIPSDLNLFRIKHKQMGGINEKI